MLIVPAGENPELAWFKSSYSSGEDMVESCVEAAATPHTIHIRDSKSTNGPQLAFPSTAWSAFVTYAAQS